MHAKEAWPLLAISSNIISSKSAGLERTYEWHVMTDNIGVEAEINHD